MFLLTYIEECNDRKLKTPIGQFTRMKKKKSNKGKYNKVGNYFQNNKQFFRLCFVLNDILRD